MHRKRQRGISSFVMASQTHEMTCARKPLPALPAARGRLACTGQHGANTGRGYVQGTDTSRPHHRGIGGMAAVAGSGQW